MKNRNLGPIMQKISNGFGRDRAELQGFYPKTDENTLDKCDYSDVSNELDTNPLDKSALGVDNFVQIASAKE